MGGLGEGVYKAVRGGGQVKSFSHAEGEGAHMFLGILMPDHTDWFQTFQTPLTGEAQQVLPMGVKTIPDLHFFYFVAPPNHVINNQSLRPLEEALSISHKTRGGSLPSCAIVNLQATVSPIFKSIWEPHFSWLILNPILHSAFSLLCVGYEAQCK